MADIAPVLANPQVESTQFQAAVSENMIQTIAGAQTFLNYFTYAQKRFDFNGAYSIVSAPFVGTDNIVVFEFNAQIIDVWLYVQTPGGSGSTAIDLQVMASPGGSWTSIFTTIPSISYQAGTDIWVGAPNPALIGSQYSPPAYVPPANTTPPVLNAAITNTIVAGSAMRAVLTASQAIPASNACIIAHFRNR